MPTPITAPAPAPFFILLTSPSLKAAGLPCKVTCYKLDKLGLLKITVDPAGRRGITIDDARRFFAHGRPLAEMPAGRDVGKATAASVESRRGAP
jgi:hypothetical protein